MKIARKLSILLISIVFLLMAGVIATPTLLKSYINNNGEDLIGRKLYLKGLYHNPLTGYTRFTGFQVMELNDTAVFLSIDTLIVNLDLYKIFSRTFSISTIRLTNPEIQINKLESAFNYTDLAMRITSEEGEKPEPEEKSAFNIELKNIALAQGGLRFHNQVTGRQWLFDDIDVSIPGLYFDNQNTDVDLDLTLRDGGELLSNTEYNNEKGTYKIQLKLADINLSPLQSNIKEYLDISDLGASMDAELEISGEVGDLDELSLTGTIEVSDYYFSDSKDHRFLSGDKITTVIEDLTPMKRAITMESITLQNPVIFYEFYADSTDNIRPLILEKDKQNESEGPKDNSGASENPEIDSTGSSNFELMIRNLKVENGQLDFKDNNPEAPVEYQFSNIAIDIENISEQDTTKLNMIAKAPDNGDVSLYWEGNFFDLNKQSFTLRTNLPGLPAFSPYTISFFGVPIEEGSFNYVSTNHIYNGNIEGLHTIKASGITLGKKKGFESLYDIPLKVGLYLLEDKEGNIHMEIPVEGSTSDPDFRYSEIVVKAIVNGIVKLVTSPISLLGKLVGAGDNLDVLCFDPVNLEITPDLEVKLDYLVEAIKQKPQLRIKLIQHFDPEVAGEELAVYMVKLDYYKKRHGKFDVNDYYVVDRIDLEDDEFSDYLTDISKNAVSNEEELVNTCLMLKEKQVQTVLDTLPKGWNNLVTQFLIAKGVLSSNIEIENTVDENGKFVYELQADFLEDIEQAADSLSSSMEQ